MSTDEQDKEKMINILTNRKKEDSNNNDKTKSIDGLRRRTINQYTSTGKVLFRKMLSVTWALNP